MISKVGASTVLPDAQRLIPTTQSSAAVKDWKLSKSFPFVITAFFLGRRLNRRMADGLCRGGPKGRASRQGVNTIVEICNINDA